MCALPVSQNYASPRIVRPAGLVVLRYWVPIRIGCPNRGAVEASTAEKSAQEKLHYQDVLKYLTERSYRAEAEKAIMEEDDPKESERFHSQRWGEDENGNYQGQTFSVHLQQTIHSGTRLKLLLWWISPIRHNELRDIPATILTEVSNNAGIEPVLQKLSALSKLPSPTKSDCSVIRVAENGAIMANGNLKSSAVFKCT
ncbi:hypothetical protein EMCRGX_G022905 [Ephydatia muelleri]